MDIAYKFSGILLVTSLGISAMVLVYVVYSEKVSDFRTRLKLALRPYRSRLVRGIIAVQVVAVIGLILVAINDTDILAVSLFSLMNALILPTVAWPIIRSAYSTIWKAG